MVVTKTRRGGARRARCILCSDEIGVPWREIEGHHLLQCEACELGWTEEVPSDAELEAVYDAPYFYDGGSGYPDYVAAEAAHRATASRASR